jgi:hypothetical protein
MENLVFFFILHLNLDALIDSVMQCCGSESENPNVLAGSESESVSEKQFGFGYGFGFRHCCRMKIFVKNQKSNT